MKTKRCGAFLRAGLLAAGWMAGLAANAAITQDPVLSSQTHTANQSSTQSLITMSWTAASGDNGPVRYEWVLDRNASHTASSFQAQLSFGDTPDNSDGTVHNVAQNFTPTQVDLNQVPDETWHFHLRALDDDGIVQGSPIVTFGPIILDSAPSLSASSPITPATGDHTQAIAVTVNGNNIMDGATLDLVNGTKGGNSLANVALTGVNFESVNQLTATVPANTAPGVYDLRITNAAPFNQQFTRADAYESTNQIPIANAGANDSVTLTSGTGTISLDGSASSDPDGDTLQSFSWTTVSQPAGSNIAASFSGATPSAITINTAGTYEFSLVVNDGADDSASDTVVFTASDPAGNNPPTAKAGVDQLRVPGSVATLNGVNSSDPDGDPLTFSWTLTSVPGASSLGLGAGDISNATSSTATFTPDVKGAFTASLTVNDGTVNSSADTVVITANTQPVADAGGAQFAAPGTPITLDGSGSTDADGDALTFAWSKVSEPGGSSVSLSSTTAEQPTFTPTVEGDYTFSLIAKDDIVNSAPAEVTVTIGTATLDVDGDGAANASDGVMIQRRLTGGVTVTTGVVTAADNATVIGVIDASSSAYDVDGSGTTDASDGVMIQRRLTGGVTVTTGVVTGADNATVIGNIDALPP